MKVRDFLNICEDKFAVFSLYNIENGDIQVRSAYEHLCFSDSLIPQEILDAKFVSWDFFGDGDTLCLNYEMGGDDGKTQEVTTADI